MWSWVCSTEVHNQKKADRSWEVHGGWKREMSKANWSKQTRIESVGVDLGTVSRFKTTVVSVITGCSLACCGSGWVRGWVLGTWVGKSLLWFLVEIHLSWLCQPPTFSILEQWKRKHWDLCLRGLWCYGARKNLLYSHNFCVHSALP